ncbi:LysR family transcriptional regulator [Henriciella aquimarina]|uniref:LysR family transcriptional regulator n=1 Tax=Henriciella aquimarina TaxID=545261 RepID=UPI001301BDAB|nr:LysR family transcriptional regulator [Henriciella aquimarina]
MSVDRLDWDKLRVFGAVAELKSFTAAAKRLGESTPTVSRKIDDLERKLNCELLVRSPRGVELTEAGRMVARHVQTINGEANSIWSEVCNLDLEATGKIRIMAGDGMVPHWLTRSIPAFHDANPGIELDISITNHEPDLLGDETDITLAFSEPRHRDLQSVQAGVLHYIFFAAPEYLERKGYPESLFDLQGHSCLLHSGYINQIDSWSTRAHDLKKALTYAVITNSGTVLREACAAGAGIALLPSYLAEIDPRLKPLHLQEIAPIRFWIVYTHRLQQLSRGRIVIDWIRRQFSPDVSPWFMDTFVHPDKRGIGSSVDGERRKSSA